MPTVYVNWYHGLIEGELLPDEFLGMRQVRITIDGHKVVALFTPSHIYHTTADAKMALGDSVAKEKLITMQTEYPATPDEAMLADESLLVWVRYKLENWDNEHNHIKVEALDGFYKLWRETHSATPIPIDSPHNPYNPRYTVAVDPAKPGGDRTGIVPVTAILPQTQPPLPLHSKPQPKKLTKKQLRSAEAIQFTDSVQTSIFDLL